MGSRSAQIACEQEGRRHRHPVQTGPSAYPGSTREGGHYSPARQRYQGQARARSASRSKLGTRASRAAPYVRVAARHSLARGRIREGCYARWTRVVRDLHCESACDSVYDNSDNSSSCSQSALRTAWILTRSGLVWRLSVVLRSMASQKTLSLNRSTVRPFPGSQ